MKLTTTLVLLCLSASAAAQVGELDPDFGNAGVQTSSFNVLDEAWDIALHADGRIVVVGASEGTAGPSSREARVARYLPDGALDQSWTFNNWVNGCGDVPETFYTVAIEPDGHVLAGGYAQFDCDGPQRDFWIHRISPSGSSLLLFERPVFGGELEQARDLALLPDGRIVVVGFTGESYIPPTFDLAVARYLADGSLDETFGTGGEVMFDLTGDFDFANRVAVQPDGKILIAGSVVVDDQRKMLLLRLNADGSLDESFGTGGYVIPDFGGIDDNARDLALQADGKIVIVGHRSTWETSEGFLVARYTPDGTLDTNFGTDGVVIADFAERPSQATSVLIQPDGKIVAAGFTVVGSTKSNDTDFAILRLLPDGTLDPSFANSGKQLVAVSVERDIAHAIAIQPDGHIVLAGYTEYVVEGEVHRDFALARLLGDSAATAGEPDASAPTAFALHAAYPNPFAHQTTLAFDLPVPAPVRLAVYDVLGRRVAVIVDEERPAGRHEAVLDGAGLPGGVYLVRIEAGAFAATRRVVLVR